MRSVGVDHKALVFPEHPDNLRKVEHDGLPLPAVCALRFHPSYGVPIRIDRQGFLPLIQSDAGDSELHALFQRHRAAPLGQASVREHPEQVVAPYQLPEKEIQKVPLLLKAKHDPREPKKIGIFNRPVHIDLNLIGNVRNQGIGPIEGQALFSRKE